MSLSCKKNRQNLGPSWWKNLGYSTLPACKCKDRVAAFLMAESKKMAGIHTSSRFWHCFKSILKYSKEHEKCLDFFCPTLNGWIYEWASGWCWAFRMACKDTHKWNCVNPKTCQNSEILRILALSSDLLNFTFKYSQRACKVSRLFLSKAVGIGVWVTGQEKWRQSRGL